ncbi:MAG: hypothetical protein V4671_22660 [Armatimonadota bacterium]
MSSKSQTIQQEISGLQSRRRELATDLVTAAADLSAKREGLVAGTSGVGEVTNAQATYSALTEAIKALDERIEAAGERLQRARDEEAAVSRAERLWQIEKERQTAIAEFAAAYAEANSALHSPIARMLATMSSWAALGKEARNLQEAGGKASSAVIGDRFPWPKEAGEYGNAVTQAYQEAGAKIERARMDERRAAFAQRRTNNPGPAGDAFSTGDAAESLRSLRN